MPLNNPLFRAVWIATLVANFGWVIQSVGASWMMTTIAGSAEMVALVQASVTLPIMIFSLVAGAVADNFDRRRMILIVQTFLLLISAALAACAWSGLITPWLLLAFTFVLGCGIAFSQPALQASVGDMVERADLPGAVALNSMGFNIARSAGPAIGGAIVAFAGSAASFAVNAASNIGLIFVIARWRPPPVTDSLPRETLGVAIVAGLRYVVMSPAIIAILCRSLLFGFGAAGVPSLLPLVAFRVVAGGPVIYGLLLGAFGAGAVAGTFINARLRGRRSAETIIRLACIGFAIASPLTGYSLYLPVTIAALMLAGVSWFLALGTFNVIILLHSPRWVVGRTLSMFNMAVFGGMAGGAWLWGVLAEDHGVGPALLTAGIALIGCALLGVRLTMPDDTMLNLDPVRRLQTPDTDVEVELRSGPVVVTLEYRILEADRVRFLTVMAERRRIRRRDGARDWTLLRDLADREIWIERFRMPTWLEYIRHNGRFTHEDAVVTDRVSALHQGPSPPVVRRMIERRTGATPAGRDAVPRELSSPFTDPALSS